MEAADTPAMANEDASALVQAMMMNSEDCNFMN